MSQKKELDGANLPQEVIAIVGLERNREAMTSTFSGNMESLMLSAGDTVRSWPPEKQLDFMNQFALHVAGDEKLAPCFETAVGKRSIVQALRRSLETGLQVGGKHAYLVPQRAKKGAPIEARFSIRAEGYLALLCGGSKPIFRDIKWGRVYQNDDFICDEAAGEIKHSHGMVDRGQFVGVWVQIIKISDSFPGRRSDSSHVFAFPKSKIEQWKSASRSQDEYSPWKNWPEEMAEQASIRHACSRFEDAKDMLAQAIHEERSAATTGEQSDSIAERAEIVAPSVGALPEKEVVQNVPTKPDGVDQEGHQEMGDEELDLF